MLAERRCKMIAYSSKSVMRLAKELDIQIVEYVTRGQTAGRKRFLIADRFDVDVTRAMWLLIGIQYEREQKDGAKCE